MNELTTREPARRVRSDPWRLAPRRRGRANSPGHRRLLLEPLEDRTLLSAGDLDPTFGDGGKVTIDFGYAPGYGDVVAVQGDGKIVWAGSSDGDFALARYNADGSLDTSFGEDGKVTTDFYQGSSDVANAVAIDADGKIVVAGNSSGDFALARYNSSDGSLDTSFGDGGLVTTDFRGSVHGMAIYPDLSGAHDGKIVVVGYSYQGASTRYDFALARYNTDGSLDTTFDSDGKVMTDFGSRSDYARGVAIDLAGKIVVAGGTYQSATGYDFALARYNSSDGSLDTTFDGDGKVTTDFGSFSESASGVAIDPAGKIVVVGTANHYGTTGYDFALARYNSSDGSLDTTFGGDGKVTTDFGSTSESASGVAIDPAGNIVVVGNPFSFGAGGFALARFNGSDGGLDTTFGNGGFVTTNFGSASQSAHAVVIDADGKIVVGGELRYQSGYGFGLARYDADFGVAPITAPGDPVEVNTEITASAIFTDQQVTRTHTALWDWGDNTTSPGTVTEPTTEDPGTVSDSHTYTAPGVYTITLTVNAMVDGTVVDSDQSVFQYVVVFDPSAGFVTGGGWIDSPQGAYLTDPWLSDKANFGFNAKYKNGTTVPTGETVFKVADLTFKSTDYQWLFVSGSKAQYKGSGTINREGDYGFMLTVIDGQVDGGEDTFRIKIWNKDNDTVVYDNQLGAADGADPATLLGGGSIVIHDGGDALHAAGGTSAGIVGATLAQATLTPVVEQAMSYWAGRGVGADTLAELAAIDVRVADLAPSVLGVASSSNLIWIDRDAAGFGWKDPLGTLGSPAAGMDLLSVVTHELGHKLGFDHGDAHDVMAATLVPGVRTLPTPASLQENVFAVQHVHSLAVEPSFSSRNVSLWFPRGTASFQTLHTESVPAEKSQAVRTRDEFFHALALDEDQAAAVDGRLRDDVDHEIAMETIGDLSEFLADGIGQEEPEDEAQDALPGEDVVEMLALGL